MKGAGTNYTVMYLAKYLKAKGIDVTVLSIYTYSSNRSVDGVNLISFKESGNSYFSLSLVKHLLNGDSDAYIFVGILWFNMFLPWLRFRKLVLIPQWHKDFTSKNMFTKIFMRLYRLVLKVSFKLVQPKTVCFTDEERLLLRGFLKNISVMPLGLDFNRALWQFYKVAPLQKKPEGFHRLLYVGRVVDHKFPLFILDVLKIVDKKVNGKFILHVVGPAEKMHLELLQSKLKNFSFKDRVIFTGGVSDEELATFFKNADVFVFPSLSESFGFTVVEGLYAGLPIVACRTGIVPYLEKNGLASGVDYGDVPNFANKLLICIENSDVIKAKLLNVKPEIEKTFTINNFLDYVYKIIR